ncbi:MAG: hypothetical protein V3W34_04130 [Phycisphaerae bacterium]
MAVWSIVPISELPSDSRLDAEYYQPEFVNLDRLLELQDAVSWGEIDGYFIVGPFGSSFLVENYEHDSPFRYVRGRDVKPFFLLDDQNCSIPETDYHRLAKYHLKRGDLLVSVVGTLGNVAIVTDDMGQCVFSCKSTAYRSEGIDPFFLCAYLNSAVGQAYFRRLPRGHVQTGLNLPDLQGIPVPRLSSAAESDIGEIVRRSYESLRDSKDTYAEAEALLESALGLDNLDLTPRLYYERSYADVQAAARFDAEYYQPPKKAVLDALGKMPGQTVSDQYRSVRQLWQPDQADDTEQVRNYDLTDALQPFLDDTVEPTTRETIASTKKKLKPGDLVVSRLRHYLKEIAVVLDAGPIQMVGSTEFIVLRPQKGAVCVEALLVYLRSKYAQTVLKWCQDGSNHPRFNEKELLRLRVPDAMRDHQDEIAAKVRASIDARRDARRLLGEAKSMVEKAILGETGSTPNGKPLSGFMQAI